jgi:hypothetical protein
MIKTLQKVVVCNQNFSQRKHAERKQRSKKQNPEKIESSMNL